jgi:hypothetical protein
LERERERARYIEYTCISIFNKTNTNSVGVFSVFRSCKRQSHDINIIICTQ